MFIIRLDRQHGGGDPVTLWLKTADPVRLGDRDDAMRFATRGEAFRAAQQARLVGWVIEDA